jgi:hypothetical protein
MPERRVPQDLLPPAVRRGQHPADPTPGHRLIGLDHQDEPISLGRHRQDTHPRHAEHHRRGRAALTTVHVVEAFEISLLGRC